VAKVTFQAECPRLAIPYPGRRVSGGRTNGGLGDPLAPNRAAPGKHAIPSMMATRFADLHIAGSDALPWETY
jgi:hypothetical protein